MTNAATAASSVDSDHLSLHSLLEPCRRAQSPRTTGLLLAVQNFTLISKDFQKELPEPRKVESLWLVDRIGSGGTSSSAAERPLLQGAETGALITGRSHANPDTVSQLLLPCSATQGCSSLHHAILRLVYEY